MPYGYDFYNNYELFCISRIKASVTIFIVVPKFLSILPITQKNMFTRTYLAAPNIVKYKDTLCITCLLKPFESSFDEYNIIIPGEQIRELSGCVSFIIYYY